MRETFGSGRAARTRNLPAPRVSIILPTYGRPSLLPRAIGSVIRQTYRQWELIVVDDNGVESQHRAVTTALVDELSKSHPVTLVCHEHNLGGGAARNTGVRLAKGEYVAFIDDDDVWDDRKLERQVDFLDSESDQVALVTCGYRKSFWKRGIVGIRIPDQNSLDFESLLQRNQVGTTSAVLCRRDALVDIGMFDETLPSKQDVDLYVRLARSYRLGCVEEILMTWHRHAGDSIGKNLPGVIRAHQIFHEKYAGELAMRPRIHAYRLRALARLYVKSGEFREARRVFLRALRLNPTVPLALELLTANRVIASVRMTTLSHLKNLRTAFQA